MTTQPEYYPIELLHWAGMDDQNLVMVEDILSLYPDYANTVNNDKENALIIATRLNNIAIMQYLLDSSTIDYLQTTKEGNFLMVAIKCGRKDLSQLIFEKYFNKIDLKAQDFQNKTLFHLAASKGYEFIFQDPNLIKDSLFSKDIFNQSCLFDCIDNYSWNQNFLCFDMIQDQFTKSQLQEKNHEGLNILEFFHQVKIPSMCQVSGHSSKVIINEASKERAMNMYMPIINILEQRMA